MIYIIYTFYIFQMPWIVPIFKGTEYTVVIVDSGEGVAEGQSANEAVEGISGSAREDDSVVVAHMEKGGKVFAQQGKYVITRCERTSQGTRGHGFQNLSDGFHHRLRFGVTCGCVVEVDHCHLLMLHHLEAHDL